MFKHLVLIMRNRGQAEEGRESTDDRDASRRSAEAESGVDELPATRVESEVFSGDDDAESPSPDRRKRNQSRDVTSAQEGHVVVPRDLLVVPENNRLVRDRDPRTRGIRRGISILSWVTGLMLGSVAYIGGLPAGTVLFLIVSGVGYIGSEIGGHLVVARLNRLEGGRLLAIAERAGNIRRLENVGDRICLSLINLSLNTRHARPNSIANSAERARIQDRGVEFCALLTAIGYGGLSVVRLGFTLELLSSVVIFTSMMSAGRGYLVAVRRGAELHLNNVPRIRAISDPMERRAKVLLRSLYAPTAIGDFLIWCGVVGRPLINAGLMLPFGFVARFLPQSGRSFVTGMVGLDVISDIQEAFISADLLIHGVLPENIEEVASKKTLKYKIYKSILYALIPFLAILITYLALYYHYNLAIHISKEVSVVSFLALAGGDMLIVWCNFKKLDRFLSGLCSRCSGICSSKEDRGFARKITVRSASTPQPAAVANVDGGVEDDTLDQTVMLGDVSRTRSAFHIFRSARAALGASPTRAEDVSSPIAHARVMIDSDGTISGLTLRNMMQKLKLKSVGTTPQGRNVQILEPGQKSTINDLQKAIDLDAQDKLIFISDSSGRILHLHLNDVTQSRQVTGVSINMHRVDFLFDRNFDLVIDEQAFTAAIQQLELNPVGVTPVGRAIYIIAPGQTSRDVHVQRLLQLEQFGTKHCFIACAIARKSVYCPVAEIFGSNTPSAIDVERNIAKADLIFDRKTSEAENPRVVPGEESEDEREVVTSGSDGREGGRGITSRRPGPRVNVRPLNPSLVMSATYFDEDNGAMSPRHSVFGEHLRSSAASVTPYFDEDDGAMSPRRSVFAHLRPSAAAVTPYGEEDEESVFSWHTSSRRVHFENRGQHGRVEEIDEEAFPPSPLLAPKNSPFDSEGEEEELFARSAPGSGYQREEVIVVEDGVEDFRDALHTGVGIGIEVNNEPFSPEKKKGMGAVFRSMAGVVSTGVSSFFSRFGRKKEAAAVNDPFVDNSGIHVAVAEPIESGSDSEEEGSDESKDGASTDNDIEEYYDTVTDQKPVSQEWYYDDRQSINGGAIDLGIFQESGSKELKLELPKTPMEKLLDKYDKAYKTQKTYRQLFEEINKELEEGSVVRPCYLDEEEEENDEQEEKRITQKMFDEVMGSRSILPKKYDIPDDINFVPQNYF